MSCWSPRRPPRTATRHCSSCRAPTAFCAPLPRWRLPPTSRCTTSSRRWSESPVVTTPTRPKRRTSRASRRHSSTLPFRHPRESGGPEQPVPVALDSRFRGNDADDGEDYRARVTVLPGPTVVTCASPVEVQLTWLLLPNTLIVALAA